MPRKKNDETKLELVQDSAADSVESTVVEPVTEEAEAKPKGKGGGKAKPQNKGQAKKAEGKPKNLTMADIKKGSKILDAKGEVTVNFAGQDFNVSYDLVFRKTKQRNMLKDIVKFFEHMGLGGGEDDADFATIYTTLMLVKHFTSMDISDDIEEARLEMGELIDMEILGPIVNALPDSEVQKMYELLADSLEGLTAKLDEIDSEIKRAEGDIENPEVQKYLKQTVGDEPEPTAVEDDGEEVTD